MIVKPTSCTDARLFIRPGTGKKFVRKHERISPNKEDKLASNLLHFFLTNLVLSLCRFFKRYRIYFINPIHVDLLFSITIVILLTFLFIDFVRSSPFLKENGYY
jgi:hypothetical protein